MMPRMWIERLMKHGPIELRALGPVNYSGVFQNAEAFWRAVGEINGKMDVYNTINPVSLPATDKLIEARDTKSARDTDIARIITIPFDFDPVRETGMPSTEEQIREATQTASRCIQMLGWGTPWKALSGNGAHTLYETDLPNNKEVAELVRRIYHGLYYRLSDDRVRFDRVVRNPSRIFRTYGTVNMKSGTVARIWKGEHEPITLDMLRQKADELSPKPKRRRRTKLIGDRSKRIDIVRFMQDNGFYLRPANMPGKHWVICPWEHEHTHTGGTDTVIWEDPPTFHCSHSHCDGRTWRDVLDLFND